MFLSLDNDPWNTIGSSPGNQGNGINQLDSFAGIKSNLGSAGLNGNSSSKASNDPWGSTQPSDVSHGAQPSMDPFSPVAQSQLAEFDLLRDQMEQMANVTSGGLENNGGKFLDHGPSLHFKYKNYQI